MGGIQPPAPMPQQPSGGGLGMGSLPAQGQPDQAAAPTQVYTMPEKFMPSGGGSAGQPGGKKGGGGKKILLIFGIVVAVLVIIVAVAVYVLQVAVSQQSVQQPTTTNDTVNVVVNTNENEDENTNEASLGEVLNLDVNEDLEENVNEELFPDENANTDANTNTASVAPFPDRSSVADARDRDKDKLTDEEEALYGTKFELPDTDRDGYIDGTEVANGFSPSNPDDTLLDAGDVIEYENEQFKWTISYPAKWFAEPLDDTNREVLFTSDEVEGEVIEVIFSDNPEQQTAAEWFAAMYEDLEPDDLDPVTVGNLKGIVSPDGFTYYFSDAKYIIGILYTFGTADEVHFRTTFDMMVESFQYTPKKSSSGNGSDTNTTSNTNTNVNTNTNINTNANTNS